MNATIAQASEPQGAYLGNVLKSHRLGISLAAICMVIGCIALSLYGWDYYVIEQAHRPLSPKHWLLKPSGPVGLRLGVIGLALFIALYLYPLRKRYRRMASMGKIRNWLYYHVLLGLMAPVFVSFHAAFKIHGIAGMAYWTMLALAASGLIGRYLYTQIPRSLNTAELSLKEIQELGAQLSQQLNSQKLLSESAMNKIFHLPDIKQIQAMSVFRALGIMIISDFRRPFVIWKLRRRGSGPWANVLTLGGMLPSFNKELEEAISIVWRQVSFSKKILFLSKTQSVFHLWHVIHRPFSISFAILVVIHITIVILLGYF
jgi:hypothetical protein